MSEAGDVTIPQQLISETRHDIAPKNPDSTPNQIQTEEFEANAAEHLKSIFDSLRVMDQNAFNDHFGNIENQDKIFQALFTWANNNHCEMACRIGSGGARANDIDLEIMVQTLPDDSRVLALVSRYINNQLNQKFNALEFDSYLRTKDDIRSGSIETSQAEGRSALDFFMAGQKGIQGEQVLKDDSFFALYLAATRRTMGGFDPNSTAEWQNYAREALGNVKLTEAGVMEWMYKYLNDGEHVYTSDIQKLLKSSSKSLIRAGGVASIALLHADEIGMVQSRLIEYLEPNRPDLIGKTNDERMVAMLLKYYSQDFPFYIQEALKLAAEIRSYDQGTLANYVARVEQAQSGDAKAIANTLKLLTCSLCSQFSTETILDYKNQSDPLTSMALGTALEIILAQESSNHIRRKSIKAGESIIPQADETDTRRYLAYLPRILRDVTGKLRLNGLAQIIGQFGLDKKIRGDNLLGVIGALIPRIGRSAEALAFEDLEVILADTDFLADVLADEETRSALDKNMLFTQNAMLADMLLRMIAVDGSTWISWLNEHHPHLYGFAAEESEVPQATNLLSPYKRTKEVLSAMNKLALQVDSKVTKICDPNARTLVTQGEEHDGYLYIIAGSATLSKNGEKGLLEYGTIIGHTGLQGGQQKRDATVTVSENTDVYKVHIRDFLKLSMHGKMLEVSDGENPAQLSSRFLIYHLAALNLQWLEEFEANRAGVKHK